MKKSIIYTFALFTYHHLIAQSDSTKLLQTLDVTAQKSSLERLPSVQNTYIWSGKKNEVIYLQNADVNIAEKTPRQIFAKIPGIFVYDMDGTGNQINISTRGLDPHRGWEFNIRNNGIIVNSDIYGYPASHFSLPMEAIERIELVRGTGALQYGAQFGGMLNYVSKQPDTTRPLSIESINSLGTYGLVSTYNAISGKLGKWEYSAYYTKRVSKGYRQNSESDFDGQSIMLCYRPNANMSIKAEMSRSNYLYHIPGPLTDSMFAADPRQASRSRNYFNPEIYVPSLQWNWQISPKTALRVTTSAVLGERRSVLFDKPANVADKIDPITLTYSNRQIDIDNFNSYTTEARFLKEYEIKNTPSVLTIGVQYFNNDLHRQQLGKGTTGSNFDLTVIGAWGRDIHFKTQNIAFFLENKFQLTPSLSVNAGLRVENGHSDMSGVINYLNSTEIPNTIKHSFPLLGINAEYKLTSSQNFYAGFSQAYRPVIFKDIIPASIYEKSDKNLKNAQGYNFEAGFRGSATNFKWDIGVFQLQYNNRLGNQTISENGQFYIFRTNIGNSMTRGIEAFGEYSAVITNGTYLNIFSSTSYMNAHYDNAQIRVGNENKNISGNEVESVPQWISRNGISFKRKRWSSTLLYSYTAQSYADPLNTILPSANGAVGMVPAYGLWDFNLSWRISQQINIRASINNLTNKTYFTKRPLFYPGPGIWTSDGRSANISVAIKI